MLEKKEINELTDNLKEYVKVNYELIKLEATQKASVIVSSVISKLIICSFLFMFILFISIATGFYFSMYFNNTFIGFALVAGFYLLVAIVLILIRKRVLEKSIRDKIIRIACKNI